MFGAIFKATYISFQKGMTFCCSIYEPMRDKTNKMDQKMDFRVLVFFDRIDNAL